MRTQRDIIHELNDLIYDHNQKAEAGHGIAVHTYVYRSTIEPIRTGNIMVIQYRNIAQDHYIDLRTADNETLEQVLQDVRWFISNDDMEQHTEKTPEEAKNV